MANYLPEIERASIRANVLHAAAKIFLEKGYTQSTTREIAKRAGVNVSTMNRFFGTKENIFCELVSFALDGQFAAAWKLLSGKTEDKILYYAAETTLQLYMAEGNEAVRELYATAYSLPHSSELIRQAVADKLVSVIFKEYHPDFDIKDFYEMEIASGSIIRGYMMVKSNEQFTIDQKVQRFLEASLRIYQVPEEKIREAVCFVQQFDYPVLAQKTIADMLEVLESAIIEKAKEATILHGIKSIP